MNFKNLFFVFLIVVLSSTTTLAVSKIFNDVQYDSWYGPAVTNLSELGVIEGYADGSFRPDEGVNRAEIAVMLDRMLQYIENGEVSSGEVQVNLDLPAGWLVDESLDLYNSIAYYNPDSLKTGEGYTEGLILMSEIENLNDLDVFEYYEAALSKCKVEHPEPDNVEQLDIYISSCWAYDIDEDGWIRYFVDGYEVFKSPRMGVPESGEFRQLLYVKLDDKFVEFIAYYTGLSAEIAQPKVEAVFDSLRIE